MLQAAPIGAYLGLNPHQLKFAVLPKTIAVLLRKNVGVCFLVVFFNWPFRYASPCRRVQEKMAEPRLDVGGMAYPATMADTRAE